MAWLRKTVRRWLVWVTGSALGLAIAAAGIAPAQAATAKWRIDDVISIGKNTYLTSVVAIAPTDVWAVGTSNGAVLAERYDGRAWHQVAVPKRFGNVAPNSLVVAGASSASNVWIFELLPGHTQRILRWNGHRWHQMRAPSWVFRGGPIPLLSQVAVAVGRNSAWVFSLGASADDHPSDAAHWVNGRWSYAALPTVPATVDAVSANDIWAAGVIASDQQPITMHWNGHSWATQDAPAAPGATSIVARSADDAWLLNGELSHWNGATWTSTTLPADEINLPSGGTNMAPDGQGGVWMQLWYAPTTTEISGSSLAHYRNGKWVLQPDPVLYFDSPFLLAAMTSVPHSTTLWAVGLACTGSYAKCSAVILKDGR